MPVAASMTTTSPWIVGRPRSALPGCTETSLVMASSASRAGMTRRKPPSGSGSIVLAGALHLLGVLVQRNLLYGVREGGVREALGRGRGIEDLHRHTASKGGGYSTSPMTPSNAAGTSSRAMKASFG